MTNTKYLRCGFSHNYTKLYGQTSARLLDVKRVTRSYIHPEAIDYDTIYYCPNGTIGQYELEDVPLLRLVFLGNKGIPFTTYRTDTPDHFDKYALNIGRDFEIYVTESAK